MNLHVTIKPLVPSFLQYFFTVPITQKPSAPLPPAKNLDEACARYLQLDSPSGRQKVALAQELRIFVKTEDDCRKVTSVISDEAILKAVTFDGMTLQKLRADFRIFGNIIPVNPK